MKFCPECGTASDGAKFCAECGTPLSNGAVAPAAQSEDEREVWRGTPDSVLSPIAAKKTTYVLTTERLRVEHGLLSRKADSVELYRVKDIRVKKSMTQRSRRRGDVIVLSSDASHDDIRLESVPDPDELAETIRSLVKASREANRGHLQERL